MGIDHGQERKNPGKKKMKYFFAQNTEGNDVMEIARLKSYLINDRIRMLNTTEMMKMTT